MNTPTDLSPAASRAAKNFNPFYPLLVVVGIAFCVTAFAFGVMTVRELQPTESLGGSESGRNLMRWIDQHGFSLMMGELAALAVFTVAAIATDEFWTKRARARRAGEANVSDAESADLAVDEGVSQDHD